MSVSNLNLNIQTFMSVGYHIFEYIYIEINLNIKMYIEININIKKS